MERISSEETTATGAAGLAARTFSKSASEAASQRRSVSTAKGTHPALRARSMTFTDSATNRPDAKRSGAPSGSMARARPTSCLGSRSCPSVMDENGARYGSPPARKDVCDLFMGPSIR